MKSVVVVIKASHSGNVSLINFLKINTRFKISQVFGNSSVFCFNMKDASDVM